MFKHTANTHSNNTNASICRAQKKISVRSIQLNLVLNSTFKLQMHDEWNGAGKYSNRKERKKREHTFNNQETI